MEQPFGVAPSVAWKRHLQYDLEICEVHTDLNVADPLTKTSLTSKHDQTPELMSLSHMVM